MRALRPPALSRPRPKSPLLVLASCLEHRPGRSDGVIGSTSAGVVEDSIADRASLTTPVSPRAGAAGAGARRADGAREGARQRRDQGQREPKPERLERGRPALGQRQMTGAWLLAPFAGGQGRIERLIDMSQPTIADRESPLTRSKWICRLDLLRSGPPALGHRRPPSLAWFWQAV